MRPMRHGVVVVIVSAAILTFGMIAALGWKQGKRRMSLPRRDDGVIEARVTIQRPIDDVFRFYRDFRNLPRFLGDVTAIEPLSRGTYRWTIQGPLGVRVQWTIRVTEEDTNKFIGYETATTPGLRTYWEIHFAQGSDAGQTDVREVMRTPLGRVGQAALALIGKFPAEEVIANLRRLKEVMETGRVSDTSYAVAGKFGRPRSHSDPEQ